MATGGEDSSFELYECQICLQDMVDRHPRCLQCLHTFCQECLTRLVQNRKIKCPTCRNKTDVTEGVDKLVMNFHLIKMREREMKLVSKELMLCQLCSKAKSTNKCHECNKTLCEECTDKHNKMKQFSDHKVGALCAKHGDGITHLCLRCTEGACVMCLLSDHADHDEDVKEYEEGLKVIQQQASARCHEMEAEMAELRKDVDNIRRQNEDSEKMKTGIREKIKQYQEIVDAYQEKVHSAEKILQEIESKFDKERTAALESIQKKVNETDRKYKEMLQFTRQMDTQLLVRYRNAMDTEQNGKPERDHLPYRANPYELSSTTVNVAGTIPDIVTCKQGESMASQQNASKSLFEMAVTDKPAPLARRMKSVPKLVYTISNETIPCMINPREIVCTGDNHLFVTDYKSKSVYKLTDSGKFLDKYTLCDEGTMFSVSVLDECIYLGHDSKITSLNARSIVKYNESIPAAGGCIKRIHAICPTKIIITENANPGRVFEYNPQTGNLNTRVANLKLPSFITVTKDQQDVNMFRYLITIQNEDCVHAYDKNWELLYVIGSKGSGDGQLKNPGATTLTHNNTLLVADNGNARVSEFTLDGRFLGHLLTGQHGIKRPCGLDFRFPYLWVTLAKPMNKIHCFSIAE